jgi:hypothetical protein
MLVLGAIGLPLIALTSRTPFAGLVVAGFAGTLAFLFVYGMWATWQMFATNRRERREGYTTMSGYTLFFRNDPSLWVLDDRSGDVVRRPQVEPTHELPWGW